MDGRFTRTVYEILPDWLLITLISTAHHRITTRRWHIAGTGDRSSSASTRLLMVHYILLTWLWCLAHVGRRHGRMIGAHLLLRLLRRLRLWLLLIVDLLLLWNLVNGSGCGHVNGHRSSWMHVRGGGQVDVDLGMSVRVMMAGVLRRLRSLAYISLMILLLLLLR